MAENALIWAVIGPQMEDAISEMANF